MKTKNFLIKYKSIFCINLQRTIEVGGGVCLGRCHAQSSACSFEIPSAEIIQKRGVVLFNLKQYLSLLHRLYSHKNIKLISVFILAFTFTQKTFALGDESVSKDLIFLEELKEDYYKGKASRLHEALVIFDKYESLLSKENLTKITDVNVILTAMKSMEVVSFYLATNATEYRIMSRLFEVEHVLKRYLAYGKSYREATKEKRAKLLLAFSDYLSSQVTWNQKRVGVIMNLPIWYRRILLLEPQNLRAKLKLVSWYTYSTSYAYPRQIQWLKNHETYFSNMSKVERFHVYIDYSMFYMRTLETKKAYAYLALAREIFPANFYAQIMEDFYAKGKIGF